MPVLDGPSSPCPYRHRETETETDRLSGRERQRQRERDAEKEKYRERERDREHMLDTCAQQHSQEFMLMQVACACMAHNAERARTRWHACIARMRWHACMQSERGCVCMHACTGALRAEQTPMLWHFAAQSARTCVCESMQRARGCVSASMDMETCILHVAQRARSFCMRFAGRMRSRKHSRGSMHHAGCPALPPLPCACIGA